MSNRVKPGSVGLGLALLTVGSLMSTSHGQDEGSIGPADYRDYLKVLEAEVDEAAAPVTFLELWTQPERYEGRQVQIEGRVERRFRQPSRGDFPALTELWIVDDAGNPTCLVFPTDGVGELGRTVRFEGTFLRLIRYPGADTDRLAPLLVGLQGPSASQTASGSEVFAIPEVAHLERWIASILAIVVVAILGIQHLRRRSVVRPVWSGEPPEFIPPSEQPPTSDSGLDDTRS